MPNLRQLDLGIFTSHLDSNQRMALCAAILECKALQNLTLHRLSFKDWGNDEFGKFCDVIANSNLKKLELKIIRFYELDDKKIQMFCDAIIANHILESVLVLTPKKSTQREQLIYDKMALILEQKRNAKQPLSKLLVTSEMRETIHKKEFNTPQEFNRAGCSEGSYFRG